MIKKQNIGIVLLALFMFGFVVIFVKANTPKSSGSYNLPALSYAGYGTISMDENDQLKIEVSAGTIINVYVMTAIQWNTLKNSGGITWDYEVRFKDVTSVSYVFTSYSVDDYYIVFYNKGIVSVYIEYTFTYIPYEPYEPYDPYDPYSDDSADYLWQFVLFLVIVGVILAVVLPVSISYSKKKEKAKKVESQVVNSIYCSNCGNLQSEDVEFCKNCGNKLLKPK